MDFFHSNFNIRTADISNSVFEFQSLSIISSSLSFSEIDEIIRIIENPSQVGIYLIHIPIAQSRN